MRRACACAALAAAAAAQPHAAATIQLAARPDQVQVADVDGDGNDELVTVDPQARVHVLRPPRAGDDGARWHQVRELALPVSGDRCLWTLADCDRHPGRELVTFDRSGVRAWSLRGDDDHHTLAARARLAIRTGVPRWSPFANDDVDGDGRSDLLLPRGDEAELWLQLPTGGGFRRAGTVPLDVGRSASTFSSRLSDVLRAQIDLPPLDAVDLDGDGRLDLRVQRGDRFSWRLQRDDGTFADEAAIDLTLFRDTTPRADLQLGATAPLSERQGLHSRDLDGDGVPDHVVTHRRKVWVFLADWHGPQFSHAADVKAVAQDVSLAVLWNLDDDDRPDLCLVDVQVPGAGALALGLVRSVDVPVRLIGYRNERSPDRVFAPTPAWRREIVLRLPPLPSLVDRQDELVERLLALGKRARVRIAADLDRHPGRDLLTLDAEAHNLLLWSGRGDGGDDPKAAARTLERRIAELVFADDADPVFDVDRLLDVLGSLVRQDDVALVQGARPDDQVALRGDLELARVEAAAAADAPATAVVLYHSAGGTLAAALPF